MNSFPVSHTHTVICKWPFTSHKLEKAFEIEVRFEFAYTMSGNQILMNRNIAILSYFPLHTLDSLHNVD